MSEQLPGAQKSAPQGLRDEVQRFFDRMARSLTAGDGKAIAGMWAVPAYVIGDTMVMGVGSSEEVEKFFAGAKDEYNKRGISDTRAIIERLDRVTDRIVTVRVRWPYIDRSGAEIGSETSTYTLRRDDDGDLKLCVSLMHGVA